MRDGIGWADPGEYRRYIMSERTRLELEGMVRSRAAWLERIDGMFADPDEITPADLADLELADDTPWFDNGDVWAVLELEAPETYHTFRGLTRDSADWHSTTVVFTTGGPHIEAVTFDGTTWTVGGWWGSERVSEYVGRVGWLESVVDEVA